MQAVANKKWTPEGEIETRLAAIWAGVLKLDRVGRHDNFFALGGHSLLAVLVVTRLGQELDMDVDVRDLFAHPVLASFSAHVLNVQLKQFSTADIENLLKQLSQR